MTRLETIFLPAGVSLAGHLFAEHHGPPPELHAMSDLSTTIDTVKTDIQAVTAEVSTGLASGLKLIQAVGFLKTVDAAGLSTSLTKFGTLAVTAIENGVELVAAATAVYAAIKPATASAAASVKSVATGLVGGTLETGEPSTATTAAVGAVAGTAAAVATTLIGADGNPVAIEPATAAVPA